MISYDTGVSWLPAVAVALSISGSAMFLVLGRYLPRIVIDVLATAIAATVTGMSAVVLAASAGGRVVAWLGGWTPKHGFSVGILLEVDPVGGGIATLGAALMTLALLYSWRYLEDVEAHYHALILLFLAGMTGFSLTGDLFDMFVFFELMGAAAYALTGLVVEDASAMQGAFNFGVINSLGAYISLLGVGMLYARTGQLGLAQLGAALGHHRPDALVVAALVLVLTGFLVKGAMVPLHFWLDDAHAVAPPPVCLLFSGVMVPLGLYGAFRVYWVVFSSSIPAGDFRRAFLVMGAITAVVGAVMCLGQRHIKRLLAYSTIAHVGLFLCGLALLDTDGTAGSILYVAGHAASKGALFLLAGVLLGRYGTVDEHELYAKGDWRSVEAWLWLVGGLALSGMPPFGDGLAKAVTEDAAIVAGYSWLPVLFVIVSALSGGAVLRVVGRVYFGFGAPPVTDRPSEQTSGQEKSETRFERVPPTMLVAIVILLGGGLAEGVIPGAHAAAEHAAAWFTHPAGYLAAALQHRSVSVPESSPGNWTELGVVLGFVSTLLALGVAATAWYGQPLAQRAGAIVKTCGRAFSAVRSLHSGHLGDYVAWMMTGMAVLGALIGLPLVHR